MWTLGIGVAAMIVGLAWREVVDLVLDCFDLPVRPRDLRLD